MIDREFWKDRRVFLTGHTGFKGTWISLMLHFLGAKISGFALNPETPSLHSLTRQDSYVDSNFGDVRDFKLLSDHLINAKPEIVIHMAAQPLVRQSYSEPLETFAVNVLGTVHLLEAARLCGTVKSIVNVTSDKCYENREWIWPYRENEPMGGHDPYSSSKGCSELVTSSYSKSFFSERDVGLASARAGNVIGGGDWAKDRLIPDILRAFQRNEPVSIRNPNAIRPWQHVLDPVSGYLCLAQELYKSPGVFSGAWNFGPDENDQKPVRWIADKMTGFWPGAFWILDDVEGAPHEANNLKLDTTKVKEQLGWRSTWALHHSLEDIVHWHRSWLNGDDMYEHCMNSIDVFLKSQQINEDGK